jgi:trimethylamine--corrinoid protein Co-methyltransferase
LVHLRKIKPLEVLSEDAKEYIHMLSLELLEKMGVKVHSKEALEILEKSGAKVDKEKKMAWIPPYLVEEALEKTPKIVKLCARNPKYDVRLDGKHICCITDGTGLYTIDLETGERRSSTKDDVAKSALIIDALKDADLYYPTVTPLDFPKHAHVLHEYDAAVNNTEKHFVSGATYLREEAIYLIKMAAAVAGSVEQLRKRPIISAVTCMMSPLILPLGETDAALEFSKHGIPVVLMTMPLIGATGPITPAGSVLIGNAQFLAINTVIQMKYPGAPVIYSSYPLSMEVKTGAFAVSFPEADLVIAGHIQMARYYGVPNLAGGTIGSSKVPDEQAAYEKALCGLMSMLAGGDICGTIGLLENYTVLSFEQLLIDYEMYRMMVKLAEGIEVNEDTLALDTIYKVGPEGHFMAEKHTLMHAKDVWMPLITDPRPFLTWKKAGGKSVVEVAREKVKEILATHKPAPLDMDVKRELERIIKEGEEKIPH